MRWSNLRTRLWTLLALVAIAAGGLIAFRLMNRARHYRTVSEEHARSEEYWRYVVKSFTSVQNESTEWKKFGIAFVAMAEYQASLRHKYDRAARRPWEPVTPDPPAPDLPRRARSRRGPRSGYFGNGSSVGGGGSP